MSGQSKTRARGMGRQAPMNTSETAGMTPEQAMKFTEAERLISQWRYIGKRASELLYEARADIKGIDWFDHRHHLLNPPVEFTDFWTASGDNAMSRIPIGGTVLDLCCGDGFYDYHFYRQRAERIVGVDISERAIALAQREHSAPNIEYIVGDICDILIWPFGGMYDVIICRGAIEHFDEEQQIGIFSKAWGALKDGGWFCGDTVTPIGENEAHKHEWKNENEMRAALGKVFDYVETHTLVSRERTTLFWSCKAKER